MRMIRTAVIRDGRFYGTLTKTLWGWHAYWSPDETLLGMTRHREIAEAKLIRAMEETYARAA